MKPDGNPWPGTIVSLPEAENLSSEVSVEWAEQAAKISIVGYIVDIVVIIR